MALDGNLRNFGADPTGVADSGPAFQALFNSDEAGFVEPGIYRIATPSTVTRGGIVECFGGSIATGYTNHLGENAPIRQDEQVRFICETSTPFIVKHEQFHWRGGCFDYQNFSGEAFAFDIQANMVGENNPTRNLGWGVKLRDITVLGNFLELRDITAAVNDTHQSTGAVRLNYSTNPDIVGFLYIIEVDMQVLGCEKGFYVEPELFTGQDCAQHHVKVNAIDTRSAIYNGSARYSTFNVAHFGGPVFPNATLAQNTAGIYSRHTGQGTHGNLIQWPRFDNFDGLEDGSTGYYNNYGTFDTQSQTQYLYPTTESIQQAVNFGAGATNWEYNGRKFEVGGAFIHRKATTAQLDDPGSTINNVGKDRGVAVLNTDTDMLVHANGTGSTVAWLHPVTGSPIHNT